MITQTANLAGLSTAQLVSLQHQILMDFFAPETTDEDRDNLISFQSKLDSCVPHTFVLASLFDVESMSNDIPDHVIESDPSLEWVTCPCCDGEKWLEVEGNVWTKALFADPRLAYAHRHLNSSYKVCGRCSGTGEVLDDLTTLDEHPSSSNKVQAEYEKIHFMKTLPPYRNAPAFYPPLLAMAA
jgi:hypothetical protein